MNYHEFFIEKLASLIIIDVEKITIDY